MVVKNRIEELQAELTASYDKVYRELAQKVQSGKVSPADMVREVQAIQAKVAADAKAYAVKEADELKARLAEATKAIDGFRGSVQQGFDATTEHYMMPDMVSRIRYAIGRDETGKPTDASIGVLLSESVEKRVAGEVGALLDELGKTIKHDMVAITGAKSVTLELTRNEQGGLNRSVMLGAPKATTKAKSSSGSSGARSTPLTVDGTTYPSAASARDALLPDKVGKPMNRGAIVSALTTSKHIVS